MNKKIIYYHMVWEDTVTKLIQEVNDHIRRGYSVYSTPFCDPDGFYCQAIVKYVEESNTNE